MPLQFHVQQFQIVQVSPIPAISSLAISSFRNLPLHAQNAKLPHMIPILPRLSKAVASRIALFKHMDSSSSFAGSRRLVALARHLSQYEAPPAIFEEIDERIESARQVVPQLGFAESITPIVHDPERPRPKRAAVLVCIFEGEAGDLRVILTRRSSRLSTHSGEVALPGGKTDEGDTDDAETATREAKEEIGLDPSLVNVVTVLEPFLSKHLLRVVPVIGILNEKDRFKPSPNPAEVESVFDAPLEMFIKDENRSVKEIDWLGNNWLVHYFNYETENNKYLIWGLTAGILIKAASVVFQRPPDFVEQYRIFKVPGVIDKEDAIPKFKE